MGNRFGGAEYLFLPFDRGQPAPDLLDNLGVGFTLEAQARHVLKLPRQLADKQSSPPGNPHSLGWKACGEGGSDEAESFELDSVAVHDPGFGNHDQQRVKVLKALRHAWQPAVGAPRG